jgi:hypothetical protein
MKTDSLKNIKPALSVGAIVLFIATGVSGCSISAAPDPTPPPQSSAFGKTVVVTPHQGSKEWNDANYGDSGL